MERETGIEPATNSLEGCDSTTELLPPASAYPLRSAKNLFATVSLAALRFEIVRLSACRFPTQDIRLDSPGLP